MRYALSLRWAKFALIGVLGWLGVSLPILWVLVMAGRSELQPILLIAFIPFVIWYVRRCARDRRAFDANSD